MLPVFCVLFDLTLFDCILLDKRGSQISYLAKKKYVLFSLEAHHKLFLSEILIGSTS